MKTLTIGIALATLICSPAFATPVDAVTAGAALYAAIGMAGVSGMMRHTPESIQPDRTDFAAAARGRGGRRRPQCAGATVVAAGVALDQVVARADFGASSGGSVAG